MFFFFFFSFKVAKMSFPIPVERKVIISASDYMYVFVKQDAISSLCFPQCVFQVAKVLMKIYMSLQ